MTTLNGDNQVTNRGTYHKAEWDRRLCQETTPTSCLWCCVSTLHLV